jgi:uncharacterized integral membrane protein
VSHRTAGRGGDPGPGDWKPSTEDAPAEEGVPPPAGSWHPRHHVIKRTRIGGAWLASGLFSVVLLFLLIFILENGNRVEISYLGLHGHLPLGVALLLAAVLGMLLVAIPGTGRIVQLRATARLHRLIDAGAQDSGREQAGAGPAGSTASAGSPPSST